MISKKSLFEWLIVASIVFVMAGCATTSVEWYKKRYKYDTVVVSEAIQATVRVDVKHQWRGKNMDSASKNLNKAMDELILEDIIGSRIFGKVNPPGDSKYDFLVRVEIYYGIPSLFRGVEGEITLSIIDPQTKETVLSYVHKKELGHFDGTIVKNESNTLSEIKTQLLADFRSKNPRAYVSFLGSSKVAKKQLEKASTFQKEGNYTAAFSAFKQAIRNSPEFWESYRDAAGFMLLLCDQDGVLRLAKEGLRLNPDELSLKDVLGRAQKQKGNNVLTSSTDQNFCRAQTLNHEGVALVKGGRPITALAKFEEAARVAPGLVPKAHYNAGLILEQMGKTQEAIRHYTIAYRVFLLPQDETEAFMRIVTIARSARIAVPEDADRYYRLGIIRAEEKKYSEAVKAFETALDEAPWLVDAYYNLGLMYDFTGAYAKALRAFRIYLQLAPSAQNISAVKTKIVELEDKLGLHDKATK